LIIVPVQADDDPAVSVHPALLILSARDGPTTQPAAHLGEVVVKTCTFPKVYAGSGEVSVAPFLCDPNGATARIHRKIYDRKTLESGWRRRGHRHAIPTVSSAPAIVKHHIGDEVDAHRIGIANTSCIG
jgi:hypothetical protein